MGPVFDEIPGGGRYRRLADGRWEQVEGPPHPGAAEDAPEPDAPEEDANDG